MPRIISLDTETTGLDHRHGACPFLVTTCSPDGQLKYWQWPVNPIDRTVQVSSSDLDKIQVELDSADRIILQNAKFDAHALATIGLFLPWGKVEDTFVAAHLLASGRQKDLTSLVRDYLGHNASYEMEALEKATEKCVKSARNYVQQSRHRIKRRNTRNGSSQPSIPFPSSDSSDAEMGDEDYSRDSYAQWKIAGADVEGMPSAKEKTWKFDLWLPRQLAESLSPEERECRDDIEEWMMATERYANGDSSATIMLWPVMIEMIRRKGHEKLYRERMRMPPALFSMERRGVTANNETVNKKLSEYTEESERLESVCVGIAAETGYDLTLPKGPRNASLQNFLFNHLNLPVLAETEKGSPSLSAEVKERYELELPHGSMAQLFFKRYNRKVDLDTALYFLRSYHKFLLPLEEMNGWGRGEEQDREGGEWSALFPSFNPCGTLTLQLSCQNPNTQQISKQGKANLRECFGPAPGRVWYSMDAQNIQLRIPAFECDEKELVDVFNRPNDPPYYGSYHLVIFDTLHPGLFAKYGKECKTKFEDREYQWVKNGNFARQFSAQEARVDATFRVRGGYRKIVSRFPKIDRLSRHYIDFADQYGYVLTLPDKEIDPHHGYPLQVSRTKYGDVSPTTPFCYHVAGSAQWWMCKAIANCEAELVRMRAEGIDAYMILTVHDELVFDFPAEEDEGDNLPHVILLKKTMERGGDCIGVPTPVSVERHDQTWAKGVAL